MALKSCFYLGLRPFGNILGLRAQNFCYGLKLGTLIIILGAELLQLAKTWTRDLCFKPRLTGWVPSCCNFESPHGAWKLIAFFRAYLVTNVKTLATNLFSSQFISVDYKFWNRVIRRKSNCREKMHFLQKKK